MTGDGRRTAFIDPVNRRTAGVPAEDVRPAACDVALTARRASNVRARRDVRIGPPGPGRWTRSLDPSSEPVPWARLLGPVILDLWPRTGRR